MKAYKTCIYVSLLLLVGVQVSCGKYSETIYFQGIVLNDSTGLPFVESVHIMLIEEPSNGNKLNTLGLVPDQKDGPIEIAADGSFSEKIKILSSHSNFIFQLYIEGEQYPYGYFNIAGLYELEQLKGRAILVKKGVGGYSYQ